ncbi:hypothetical protein LCGC14_0498460 [marine sediment metagenome]|uniref:Uncharacterized protein n=1 Tax=marine sediment metagenome TaxID=412755 RepID=A0A0F9SN06_9ZZZZ
MSYFSEIKNAMTWLGQQPDTIFIGQQVRYPGNAMFATLEGVPMEQRIEFPVAEDFQLGASIGMALTGKVVISIFPRMDFLMCAMNQLVNHLDKLEEFTHGQYKAKVIIRVGVGSTEPLNPGVQHCGDYTRGLRAMLKNVGIVRITNTERVMATYDDVYCYPGSYVVVEEMGEYGH